MKTTTILLSGSNLFWLSKTQNLVESQLVFSIRRHNRNNYRNSSNSRNSNGVIMSRRLETFGALTNSSRQKHSKLSSVVRSIPLERQILDKQSDWVDRQINCRKLRRRRVASIVKVSQLRWWWRRISNCSVVDVDVLNSLRHLVEHI